VLWVPPAFWRIPLDSVPIRREPGVQMHGYSDSSGGYASRACVHVPVTFVDIKQGVGATLE
jgi:hypothetical protein